MQPLLFGHSFHLGFESSLLRGLAAYDCISKFLGTSVEQVLASISAIYYQLTPNWDMRSTINGYRYITEINPVLTVYFQKWANAGRCWAADQHLLRSYKRFECNRDLKLSEVRCLEYRRSFTTRRAIFTSSSRSC